jgi:acetyl-CoA carboxylase biotin carboxyl carrier protein
MGFQTYETRLAVERAEAGLVHPRQLVGATTGGKRPADKKKKRPRTARRPAHEVKVSRKPFRSAGAECSFPAAMATPVQAHITGTVWKIEVKAGETVSEGQTVVIIESMKMEMPVEAPVSGTVESIAAAEGQAVEEGAVLLTIV